MRLGNNAGSFFIFIREKIIFINEKTKEEINMSLIETVTKGLKEVT